MSLYPGYRLLYSKVQKMPVKPESKLWHRLRASAAAQPFHWTRLESWATPGVPDVHGMINGHAFWLELKICNNKLRVNLPKLLSPHQIAWQTAYLQNGGSVYNLVDRPRSGLLELYAAGYEAIVDGPTLLFSGPSGDFDGLIDHLRSLIDDGQLIKNDH